MIRFVLMDIEGTTTSISFVHEVLFPYARTHLAEYVQRRAGDPRVREALAAVKATVEEETGRAIADDAAIQQLLRWIEEDRKHTALKSLQGYLWKAGYETGEYRGHIYPDVLPVMQQWRERGIRMGIYSSGSVAAQKLLFGYSEEGDLTPYLSAYFDTRTGHKREVDSYRKIREKLNLPAADILFLSDVPAELDAAREAGLQTTQLVRPGTPASDRHPVAKDFYEIEI